MDDPRPRAYDLLSRLFLRGVTPRTAPLLSRVPDLAPHLPDPIDADEAAAGHHRLLQREILPYASVFLEADGSLGGDVSGLAARRFEAAGLSPPASEPPDHLGHELQLLGTLAGRPGAGGGDARIFLDGHVLWWLPPLVPALRRNGDAFWGTVADLTLELAVEHRTALAGEEPPSAPRPWNLRGAAANPLDDDDAALRDVATFLMLPARSGLYLSEADTREPSRTYRLPGGFGSRVRVLETILHSAVAYDRMEEVVAGLRGVAEAVGDVLREMVDRGLPVGFVEPWTARLEATGRMLDRLERGEGPRA